MFFKKKTAEPSGPPKIFISYSRRDAALVGAFADGLKEHNFEVFMDVDSISPGADFAQAILARLSQASAVVVFVSNASLKSDFIRNEIAAAEAQDSPIVPVLLEPLEAIDQSLIPHSIRTRQFLVVRPERLREAVDQLSQALTSLLKRTSGTPALSPDKSRQAAEAIAEELRQGSQEPVDPHAVFVVHGHDADALTEVEDFLRSISVTPVVLTKLSGDDQSLFQRFFRFGEKARFAIVIVSADDYGVSRTQYEADGVGDRALQFRARQNVILELGFFYGRLGWENVFVLFKSPSKVFPNFERPSDLEGVVFHRLANGSNWQATLTERLRLAKIAH